MKPSTIYQLECSTSIFGFSLTKTYIIAAARTVVIHSLHCQQCQSEKGQICSKHDKVFDIGLIWDVQCDPTSKLMSTAGYDRKIGLWNLEDGYVVLYINL